jgi:hypothetical protein
MLAAMALNGRDEPDGAVTMFSFVPPHTNAATHPRASSSLLNGVEGYPGRYFTVRNSASEYGLSSETRGRLKEGTIPKARSASLNAFSGTPWGPHR